MESQNFHLGLWKATLQGGCMLSDP